MWRPPSRRANPRGRVRTGLLLILLASGCREAGRIPQYSPTAESAGGEAAVGGTPTPVASKLWGLFVLVPPGTALASAAPQFGADAKRTGELSGVTAPQLAKSLVGSFVDLPQDVHAALDASGLTPAGANATEDASGHFDSWLLLGRVEPKPAMVELRAYTPIGPVPVTLFPGSPVHVTEVSSAVGGGNPTVTQFRTAEADAYADQSVMWSVGSVVYILHAYGPFTANDLLGWAQSIASTR